MDYTKQYLDQQEAKQVHAGSDFFLYKEFQVPQQNLWFSVRAVPSYDYPGQVMNCYSANRMKVLPERVELSISIELIRNAVTMELTFQKRR